jgi:two-component system cell cycle response regulator
MRVLVADDDPVYRRLLEASLGAWGYEVVLADDGQAAWGVLGGDGAPEMVVLDWVMPGIGGDQICRLVRARAHERYTYVLLLSSRGDMIQGLEAGADDYLTKPFNPAELRARLNTGRRILDLQKELIAAREAMRRQATRDSLTGAWNHAAILELLDREMSRSRREERPLGVVLADLDHFKRINDTHGHLAGDAALCEVASRIASVLRPVDLIGRYGGEEFLLLVPQCGDEGTAKVCERIRARVAGEPIGHDGRPLAVTISLGGCIFRAPFLDSAVDLVRAADVALYRAKAAGRNRFELADGAVPLAVP